MLLGNRSQSRRGTQIPRHVAPADAAAATRLRWSAPWSGNPATGLRVRPAFAAARAGGGGGATLAGMATTNTTATRVGSITRAVGLSMLRDLYAQLSTVACKGLCHDSCTVVSAPQLERDVLAEHGIALSDQTPSTVIARAAATPDGKIGEKCPALTVFGRCSVYADRPFLCRVFGTVSHPSATGPDRFTQALMCDHGCEPEATMTVKQFAQLWFRVEALSRVVTGIARSPLPRDSPQLAARLDSAEVPGIPVGPDPHQLRAAPAGRRLAAVPDA